MLSMPKPRMGNGHQLHQSLFRLLIIAHRENGASVDDEDADDCESDRFSTQPTQKYAQLCIRKEHAIIQ